MTLQSARGTTYLLATVGVVLLFEFPERQRQHQKGQEAAEIGTIHYMGSTEKFQGETTERLRT